MKKTKEGQLTDEQEEQQREAERVREQQSAPEQVKERSAFTLIRAQMSASFCTDSSRPSLGRRLRRRLGGRSGSICRHLPEQLPWVIHHSEKPALSGRSIWS